MFRKVFLDHPASVGESYSRHLVAAGWIGFTLIGAGLACLVHAIVPCVFVTRASEVVARVHGFTSGRRNRATCTPAAGTD